MSAMIGALTTDRLKRNRTIMTFSQYRLGRVILVVDGFKVVLVDTPDCVGCNTGGSAPGNPRAPAPGHIGSMGLPNMVFVARPMPASELMLGVGTGGVIGAALLMVPLVMVVAREVEVASPVGGTGGVLPPEEAGASFLSSSFFLASDVDIFQMISIFGPSKVKRESSFPNHFWPAIIDRRRLNIISIRKQINPLTSKNRKIMKNSNFFEIQNFP